MTRILVYLLLFGAVLYALSMWGRKGGEPVPKEGGSGKPRRWFKPKKNPREVWVQVYETASMDEARILQARLQEEEVECLLYEQGKKDIHGNELKGIGIAVPKSQAPHSQGIISRMPETMTALTSQVLPSATDALLMFCTSSNKKAAPRKKKCQCVFSRPHKPPVRPNRRFV